MNLRVVRAAAGHHRSCSQSPDLVGGDLSGCGGSGCGVVFKLDPGGKETVLHSFTGGADGANPQANLLLNEDGHLYGTASAGGNTSCNPPSGCGVVFEIKLHKHRDRD
jgi:uncharacterized repeat protein (TIGR03803 family)